MTVAGRPVSADRPEHRARASAGIGSDRGALFSATPTRETVSLPVPGARTRRSTRAVPLHA